MCPVRQTGVSEECQLQWQTCTRSQNRSSLDQGRPLNFLPQSSTVMSSKMENKWFYMGIKSLKKCNPEGSRAGKIPMIIFGNPSSVSSLSRLFHCYWAVILGGAAVRVGRTEHSSVEPVLSAPFHRFHGPDSGHPAHTFPRWTISLTLFSFLISTSMKE